MGEKEKKYGKNIDIGVLWKGRLCVSPWKVRSPQRKCPCSLHSKSVSAEDCLGHRKHSVPEEHNSISHTQPRGRIRSLGPPKSQTNRNKHQSALTEHAGPGRIKHMSEDTLWGQISKRAQSPTLGQKNTQAKQSPMLDVEKGWEDITCYKLELVFYSCRRPLVSHFLSIAWRIMPGQAQLDSSRILMQKRHLLLRLSLSIGLSGERPSSLGHG